VSARSRGPRVLTVVKDVLSFLFAWGLIYQQVLLVPPGQADGRVLTLAGALLGVPGLSVLLPRLLAGLAGASGGMTGSDSEPVAPS
jgi:hypothetical protein